MWTAYCINSAVHTFGNALDIELENVEGKNKDEIKRKRERLLAKWLDMPLKFRSPGMVGSGKQDAVEQHTVDHSKE